MVRGGGIDSENIYIEGDNLDALKLLQETYLGRIKMIYIDPPYNTGSDAFVYDDDFSATSEEFAEASGQRDENGNLLFDLRENNESNGRFHTDWLNMLYPRLRLAKDLLSDDGAIFISIDDNEQENLRKICDEIFGENNYVTDLIWQSTPGSNTGDDIKTVTENVLLYCKQRSSCVFGTQPIKDSEKYSNKDEYYAKRGGYVFNKLDRRMTGQHYSEALNYPITAPDGTKVFPGGFSEKQEHWNWRWSASKVEWGIKSGFVVMKKTTDSWSIYFKQYEKVDNEDKPIQRTLPFQNLLSIDGANSATGTREVMNIFDGKLFDYPKPLSLIQHLMRISGIKEGVVLDFFSGSGTSAHAVMQLNAEDGGHRKFIMVQLPEKCQEGTEAYNAGYKNICEIGEERIRRAGKKIKEENPLTTADLDVGFRVFKVDSSNMKDVYYTPKDYNQETMDLFVDNIKEDRTSEDLLIQVMLELGVLLSSKIEENMIDGKEVYSVADGYLLACFDDDVTEKTVTEIAKKHPFYAVFRESGMKEDSVKTNYEQIFQTYSPNTIRKVL